MRSRGQVRFIRVSSRVQIAAAALVTLLLLAWLVAMVSLTVLQYDAQRDRLALLEREAQVVSAEERVSKHRGDIAAAASTLAQRQALIEKLVEAHIGELPDRAQDGRPASVSERPLHKMSGALPEAAQLARIETEQFAFIERLTRYADRRAEAAISAIRRLGLNPDRLLASVGGSGAEGGPYLSLASARDGSLDPRFKRLGASLSRMDALERGLAGIPQVQPASMEFISSGFGYRSDPFNGNAAFHAGLDFRGPEGAPIYAAAPGTVTFAGTGSGYGKYIEVDHGNGLTTRYAHMSRFKARVGQKVEAGAVIGAIGSTGRSTGPHLHFEVRLHGRAVNPRPFLEASHDVRQETATGA